MILKSYDFEKRFLNGRREGAVLEKEKKKTFESHSECQVNFPMSWSPKIITL